MDERERRKQELIMLCLATTQEKIAIMPAVRVPNDARAASEGRLLPSGGCLRLACPAANCFSFRTNIYC